MIKKVRRKRIVIKQKESINVRRHSPDAFAVCPFCRQPLAAFEKAGTATDCRQMVERVKTLLEERDPDEAKK